jgi:HK97 family phage prohead protease
MAEVDQSAWDGNRAMGACSSASDYRSICAGEHTTGEPDERQHWALPHHYLGKGPNAAGVRNALSRLPQTQNLKNRDGAQRHLEAHMSQINPEREHKVSKGYVERMIPEDRAQSGISDDGNTLYGYAITYDQPETIIDPDTGYTFRERIAKGAFRKTLRERGDQIQPLFNHGKDPSIGKKPLGVFKTLREDSTGLYFEVDLAATSYNGDIKALLQQGALRGNSVNMLVTRDSWTADRESGMEERTVREAMLAELGPVTFPAYAGAQASLRDQDPDAGDTSEDAEGTSPEGDAARTSSDADPTSTAEAGFAVRERELQLAKARISPLERRYEEV